MIDFLRLISPYLYGLIPILILIFVAFRVTAKYATENVKPIAKKVLRWFTIVVILVFSLAVFKMAMVNEAPRNDVDNSIKKERSNYAIDKAKQDTVTIN